MDKKKGMTQALAEFVVNTGPRKIPEESLHAAKRCLLDWLGLALVGSGHRAVPMLLDVLGAGASGEAKVIGRPERLDLLNAAMIHAYMAHVYDYDDTHIPGMVHPSAPVWAPVITLSTRVKVSGLDALLAFILGYEVETRLGMALEPLQLERQWHVTGLVGGPGASAAAGKLLNLTVEQQKSAFGIAGTYASGLLAVSGSMSKALNPGKAAHSGLFAALAAKKGLTSAHDVFDSRRGFFRVHAGRTDVADIVLSGLGKGFQVVRNSFKPYPCGFLGHASIDSMLGVRKEHSFQASDVSRIRLQVNPHVLDAMGERSPRTGLEGKFSVYHCVASALVDGACGLQHFTDEKVKDEEIAAARDKITSETVPSFRITEAHIAVVLNNGQIFEKRVTRASGMEGNPLSDEQLQAKFEENAKTVLNAEVTAEVARRVWKIEACTDIRDLLALM
jgi:2-methylcitrate dehydratase PrpD